MDDESSSAASWFGEVYRKFDSIRLADGFQYVEDQLQTIGASVEQFCSEYLPEPLPSHPDYTETSCDSCIIEKDSALPVVPGDEGDRGIVEEQSQPQTQIPLALPLEETGVGIVVDERVDDLRNIHYGNDAYELAVPSPPIECPISINGSNEGASDDSSSVNAPVLGDAIIGALGEDVVKMNSQDELSESIILVELEELPPVSVDATTPKSLRKKMAPLFFGLESPKWGSKASARSQVPEIKSRPASFSASKDCTSANEFAATDWEIL